MYLNSLKRVIGTGWGEAARSRAHPGEGNLVKPMKGSGDRTAGCKRHFQLTHGEPLRILAEIALGTERSEHLTTIIIELAVLDSTTGDHDYIKGLYEIMTARSE